MRFGSIEFSPSRWPSLITLLMLGLLMSLGFWQLDRAERKQVLLDEFQDGGGRAPFRLDETIGSFDDLQYQFASATGSYDTKRQFLHELLHATAREQLRCLLVLSTCWNNNDVMEIRTNQNVVKSRIRIQQIIDQADAIFDTEGSTDIRL